MMMVVLIVLPVALTIVLGFVIAFVWAVRSGQFDDLDSPSVRVALDDDDPPVRRERSADHEGDEPAG